MEIYVLLNAKKPRNTLTLPFPPAAANRGCEKTKSPGTHLHQAAVDGAVVVERKCMEVTLAHLRLRGSFDGARVYRTLGLAEHNVDDMAPALFVIVQWVVVLQRVCIGCE